MFCCSVFFSPSVICERKHEMHAHETFLVFSCVCAQQKHNQLSNHASNDMLHLYDDEPNQSKPLTTGPDRWNKQSDRKNIYFPLKNLQLLLLFYVIVVVFWYCFCWFLYFSFICCFWVAKPFRLHWTHTHSLHNLIAKFAHSLSLSLFVFVCLNRALCFTAIGPFDVCVIVFFYLRSRIALARLHARG